MRICEPGPTYERLPVGQSWAAAEITESTGADGSDKIQASDASVWKPSPATADKPPR